MKFIRKILLLLVVTLMLVGMHHECRAELLFNRPASAKGVDAKTLILYSETRTAYSLADDLAALKLHLRRVATQIEAIPAREASADKLASADYVVVFCPQPFPSLSPALLDAVVQSARPVLWVGYGAEQLSHMGQFDDKFNVSPFAAAKAVERVNYLGRDRQVSLSIWLPAQLNPTNNAANVIMSVTVTNADVVSVHPISWQIGPVTFFAALPTPSAGPLFSDLLLDFYGVAQLPVSTIAVRIDGYHCHQDHLEFRHLVDYLRQNGIPFIVSVIPAYWNPETKKIEDLDNQPEFVAALRYAQRNGGRLILQGYVNTRKASTGLEPEFWDAAIDRPLPDDSADYVLERVQKGIRQMLKHDLFPLGWNTPFYSSSRADYAQIARHFSTAVERVQLSDATALEKFAGSAITQDDHGRLIVPESLGVVTGQRAALREILERAEFQSRLRGTVSMVSFPAYLTDDKLGQVVRLLDQLKLPFLDLADGDHWVQLPEAVLLTGNARRHVTVQNARIAWKAYDRDGKLIGEEPAGSPVSGDQLLQCRGKGDYELFQIIEAKP